MPKVYAAILALALTLMPASSHADAGSSLQNQGSAGLSAPGGASSLGPASSGGQAGSSSADSSALQPAGTSPLQSTTSDSNGLTAPNSSTLQAPATGNDALQVISGDADGGPHQISTGTQWGLWLGFCLLFGLLAAAAIWLYRRRAHRPKRTARETPATAPQPSAVSSQRLRVTINRPASKVFKFLLDPKKTPDWIDSIAEEEASDHPPRVGTTYRNRAEGKDWSEFEITELTHNESFEFANRHNGYHVRYLLTPVAKDATELEYYEWVEHDGRLEHPFTGAELQKLKSALEQS